MCFSSSATFSWMLMARSLLLFALALATSAAGVFHGAAPVHFVLVHGASHGAWCWYKVSNLLELAGHTVDVIDLSTGISTSPSLYTIPLKRVLENLPEDDKVILVAHSFGGASITHAMEKFPEKIKAAVFVAATMYANGTRGRYVNDQVLKSRSIQDNMLLLPNGAVVFKPSSLYNLTPRKDTVLARTLVRPMPLIHQLVETSEDGYGRVPRYFIRSSEDKLIVPALQDLIVRNNPPSEVFDMYSDHSPFFSNPRNLTNLLLRISLTYN